MIDKRREHPSLPHRASIDPFKGPRGRVGSEDMSYIIKRQKIGKSGAQNAYIMEEYASYEDFVEGIIESAQMRGRGWKYRPMEITEDMVRFDVQFTKVE